MNITRKEKALLQKIYSSEYQDGSRIDHDVWLDYIVDSRPLGGVLTSLQNKGLVTVKMVPMNQSANAQNGITDSTVALTAAGVEELNRNTYCGLPLSVEVIDTDKKEMLTCIQALRGNIDVSTINNSKRSTERWSELAKMADAVIAKNR